jgi:nucleoside-diphosphate-sugar epimerase
VPAFIGDGINRWPAVHLSDADRLYRLALERQEAGSRYHAVGEEGMPLRDIAEVIGRGLTVPVTSLAQEASVHFGYLSYFVITTSWHQVRKRGNGWGVSQPVRD